MGPHVQASAHPTSAGRLPVWEPRCGRGLQALRARPLCTECACHLRPLRGRAGSLPPLSPAEPGRWDRARGHLCILTRVWAPPAHSTGNAGIDRTRTTAAHDLPRGPLFASPLATDSRRWGPGWSRRLLPTCPATGSCFCHVLFLLLRSRPEPAVGGSTLVGGTAARGPRGAGQ